MPHVDLTILNSSSRVSTSDAAMHDVLVQLWEPFLGSKHPASLRLDVTRTERGWAVREEGAGLLMKDSPWKALIEIRNLLVGNSLGDAPHILDLHAAVVVRAGSALLLVGDPYAGKTSLAIELTRKDWALFSDDVAPIDRGSCKVLPFPKPLGIKLRQWNNYFHYWRRPPPWRPENNEAFLVPATPVAAHHLFPTTIAYMIVVNFRKGANGEITDLSVGEATALCARQIRDMDQQKLRVLADICGRAHCARLTYSSNDQASSLLRTFAAQ
jgi:hypothetical protein